MITSKSLWHIDKDYSQIKTEVIKPSDGLVKIISQYSMISTGTERMIACGNAPMEVFNEMKVPYGQGDFNLPIKYGYSLVALTQDFRRVHLLHPHQDICFVKEQDLFDLPMELPFKRGCLISNMETVINAIWDADIKSTDKILVNGFGNIGSLLGITLSKKFKNSISIYDVNQYNIKMAKQLGFEFADINDEKFDLIFDTSASNDGLDKCMKACAQEGRIVALSWYGNKNVTLSLGHDFHYKRLSIISSQVSVIPKKMRDEFDFLSRKKLVCEILMDDIYDETITDVIPFEDSPKFFDKLRNEGYRNGLICLIDYEEM